MIARFLYCFPGHLGAWTQAILNSNFVASTCNAQCENAISDSQGGALTQRFSCTVVASFPFAFSCFFTFFPLTMFESVLS